MPAGQNLELLRRLLLSLPGVEEGNDSGRPEFRVKKKLVAWLLKDGESLALKCPDRELLLKLDAEAFYLTEHYRNYPIILVRLSAVSRAALEDAVKEAWRMVSPPAKRIPAHGDDPIPPGRKGVIGGARRRARG